MSIIKFDNGVRVNFDGTPTPQDIDEIAAKVAPKAPSKKTTTVEKVGDFLGIGDFGRGLGRAVFNATGGMKGVEKSQDGLLKLQNQLIQRFQSTDDPKRKARLRSAIEGNMKTLGQTNFQDLATGGLTNRQFLTSAGNVALNVALAGTPLKGAKGVKSFSMARKVAQLPLRSRMLQAGVTGGGLTASKTLSKEGATAKDAALSFLTGGVTSAGLVGLLGLAGKAFSKLTNKTPEGVYKLSTRLPRKTDASGLVEKGITGDRPQLIEKAYKDVARLDNLIKQSPDLNQKIPVSEIMRYEPLKKIVSSAGKVGYGDTADDVIKRILNAKEITLGEALELKKAIDAITPKTLLEGNATTSTQAKVSNAIADALRSIVHKKSPEIGKLLTEQRAPLELIEQMNKQMNRPAYFGGSILEFIRSLGLTPSVGTRLSRLMYNTGARPMNALSNTVLNDQVRQLLRAGAIRGMTGSDNEEEAANYAE